MGDAPDRAIVTGGTRGIGLAVCRALLDRGTEVVALGRRRVDLDGITVRTCDVTDADEVAATVADLEPVDVLVNNAGVATSNPIERTTPDEWHTTMAVNATGPFLCSRAVVPGMKQRGRGTIVTVASTAGLAGARYITAYTAAKHAAVGLTRALAAELDGTGVAAAAVCPTYVRTEMTDRTIATIREKTGATEAEAWERLAAQTPHGRILDVDEVADAVVALLDAPDANGRITVLDGAP
jgi:NAD(P)-dependent dehydrogenase (short-subunit alcohol dehydrogenase family)